MLKEEAKWLGEAIQKFDAAKTYPMLDFGSSTEEVRTTLQPWIDTCLFEPARQLGLPVYHCDIKDAAGVDLVGDIKDAEFKRTLQAKRPQSVLCASVLYAIEDVELVTKALTDVLPIGGLLFISNPYRYPAIPEPIDTGLRPKPLDLARLFPGTEVLQMAVIRGSLPWRRRFSRLKPYFGPGFFGGVKGVIRLALPFYRYRVWRQSLSELFWCLRPRLASLVVLRKI